MPNRFPFLINLLLLLLLTACSQSSSITPPSLQAPTQPSSAPTAALIYSDPPYQSYPTLKPSPIPTATASTTPLPRFSEPDIYGLTRSNQGCYPNQALVVFTNLKLEIYPSNHFCFDFGTTDEGLPYFRVDYNPPENNPDWQVADINIILPYWWLPDPIKGNAVYQIDTDCDDWCYFEFYHQGAFDYTVFKDQETQYATSFFINVANHSYDQGGVKITNQNLNGGQFIEITITKIN